MECAQVKGANLVAEVITSLVYAEVPFEVEHLHDDVWEVRVPIEATRELIEATS